ncbi:MAG: hypothetical protein H6717_01270 [Polyangiaceae bacterium]|nr:hypothetical protein [Polyangiaceae bacterium]
MSRITSGPIELTAPEDWGKISEPGEVLTLAKLGDGVELSSSPLLATGLA